VGGVPIAEFCKVRDILLTAEIKSEIDNNVRNAAYHIIEGKGATYYGVASALAYIVDVILHDQRSIMTICTPQVNIAGVENVTVSMPHVLGGDGVIGEHHPLILDDVEQEKLHHSASMIRQLISDLENQDEA
jgi:L-lactate dehydrogenase